MKQYRFKIGTESNIAWFENDEQASDFARFIGADCERDTFLFKINKDNKYCTFELEIGDTENAKLLRKLKFEKINIWEL